MRILAALLGIGLVLLAYYWAMRILMVKSARPPLLARLVFPGVRNGMYLLGVLMRNPEHRQQFWTLYVPVSLLIVIVASLAQILIGYTFIFYGISTSDLATSYTNSVSSLSVLGFGGLPSSAGQRTLALIEAFTGPIFVALLISYLASMTGTVSQRQVALKSINAEVGSARSGPELLQRAAAGPGLPALTTIWKDWASEFSSIEQSYATVEGYLLLFGMSMHDTWLSDAVTVLDAANLRNVAIDLPRDAQASRCLEEGAAALGLVVKHFRHFAVAFHVAQPPPALTRERFDALCESLAAEHVPIVADRDAAWQGYVARRAAYGGSVDRLTALVTAKQWR